MEAIGVIILTIVANVVLLGVLGFGYYYFTCEVHGKSAEHGNADAQLKYGNGHYNTGQISEAIAWWIQAARQGNTEAKIKLCQCMGDGYIKASECIHQLAESGDVVVQFLLGECYFHGKGIPANHAEAVRWYRKAAEQGNIDAQLFLGTCYQEGNGLSVDMHKAAEWYLKAAEQGDARGQCAIGLCYANGAGVSKDEEKAIGWWKRAAAQGNEPAKKLLAISLS